MVSIKEKMSLNKIIFMSVFVFTMLNARAQDLFVNDSYLGYNGTSLKSCNVIKTLGRKKVKYIMKNRLTDDVRLVPCYWNDSLCYGIIDIVFVSKLAYDLYPFFIDKDGEIFQLFLGKQFVEKSILDPIEIINKLELNHTNDDQFIQDRIAKGMISLGRGRLLLSNIENDSLLRAFYLKERDNW